MQTIYAFSYTPAIATGTNSTNTVWRMTYQQPIMLYKGTANTIKVVVFNTKQKVVNLAEYDVQVQLVDRETQEHFVTKIGTIATPASGVATITFDEQDLRGLDNRFYHIIARLTDRGDGSSIVGNEILYLDDNYGAFTPVTIENAWNFSPSDLPTVTTGDLNIGNIIPLLTNTYYLGNPSHHWHSIYVDNGKIGNLTIANSNIDASSNTITFEVNNRHSFSFTDVSLTTPAYAVGSIFRFDDTDHGNGPSFQTWYGSLARALDDPIGQHSLDIQASNANSYVELASHDEDSYVGVNATGPFIQTNWNSETDVKTWSFDSAGDMHLPQGTPSIMADDGSAAIVFNANNLTIQTTGTDSTIHLSSFNEDGGMILDGDLLPVGNAVNSLGSVTNQWKDLYVSNTTIYMGGIPISVDAGGNLTVNGASISGTAASAGTVTTAAQPNITSVGTLTSLNVNGNVTASRFVSNIATGTAPFTVTSTTQVANLNVATAGSATTAGTVTTAAQPNITSVGTLTGLTLSGLINLGNTNSIGYEAFTNANLVPYLGSKRKLRGLLKREYSDTTFTTLISTSIVDGIFSINQPSDTTTRSIRYTGYIKNPGTAASENFSFTIENPTAGDDDVTMTISTEAWATNSSGVVIDTLGQSQSSSWTDISADAVANPINQYWNGLGADRLIEMVKITIELKNVPSLRQFNITWNVDTGGNSGNDFSGLAFTDVPAESIASNADIRIISGANVWTFNDTGSINLPSLNNVGYQPGYALNGSTLKLGEPTTQTIITGPTPDERNPNAQRMVIQGQKGFGGNNTTGEGGDVYIWGGVGGESTGDTLTAGNGGDIKVRGGAGQYGGDGGYVKIEGGDSQFGPGGTGGYIEITAGNATAGAGGEGNGGNVTITAGAGDGSGTDGQIHLYTNSYTNHWQFTNTGNLTLPAGGDILDSNGNTVLSGGTGSIRFDSTWIKNVDTGNIFISPQDGNTFLDLPSDTQASTGSKVRLGNVDAIGVVQIQAGGTGKHWDFNSDGSITFPDNKIKPAASSNLVVETNSLTPIGGAIVFDRTSDGYLTTVGNINFGTSSWTIEAFVYLQDTDMNIITGIGPGSSTGVFTYFNGTTFNVQHGYGENTVWSGVAPALNAWHHIAVSFDGTHHNAWLDGAQLSGGRQTASVGNYGDDRLTIGGSGWPPAYGSAMKLTNLRIIVGSALYNTTSTSITVPTSQLTNITDTKLLLLSAASGSAYTDTSGIQTVTPTDVTWAAVSPFSTEVPSDWTFGADGTTSFPSNKIKQAAATNLVVETVGYNRGSAAVSNATLSYLSVPADASLALGTNNFTIEWWQYQTARGPFDSPFGYFTTGHSFYFPIGLGQYLLYISSYGGEAGDAVTISGGTLPSLNTWHHYAVVRNGTTFTLYIDGASVGTSTSTLDLGTPTEPITVGSSGGSDGATMTGYITNFRIVNGTALYTSTFTPSTTPLSNISNTDLLLVMDSSSSLITDSSNNNLTVTNNNSVTWSTQTPFDPVLTYHDWTFGSDGKLTLPSTGKIVNNSNEWTFGSDGKVTFPGGGKINAYSYGGIDLIAGPNSYAEIGSYDENNWMWVDDSGAYIATSFTGAQRQWTFGLDGSTILPGALTVAGNLTIQGTTTNIGTQDLVVEDSIINLHTQPNLAALTSDDGRDIGIKMHYYKSSDKHAFIGWDNGTSALEYYVDATETNGVISGTYGNIKAASFISNIATGTAPFTVVSTTQVANLNVATAGSLVNGNSTVTIVANANVNISSAGTANVLAVSSTGIAVTGNISGNVATGATSTTAIGYLGIPQSATATTATLAIGDAGKHIYVTTTGQTITIPANGSVAYPIGTTIGFIAGPSATTVTIAIATDTMYLGGTGTTGSRTLAAYGMATAVKVAATTWFISGNGLT